MDWALSSRLMTHAPSAQADVGAIGRIATLCAVLEQEPLFHASLGSKELFHSNLIAWFVDHHQRAAREVFGPWSRPAPGTKSAPTERERRHLDLVIHLEDVAPLIVENKIFSPPRDDQLRDYAEHLATGYEPAPEFALLSLSDPGWSAGQSQLGGQLWRHHSYGDLAVAIDASLSLVSDSYAQETMRRYRSIIGALQEIAEIVTNKVTETTPFALPLAFGEQLQKVRLTQGFEKLRARSIAFFIQDHLARHDLAHVRVVDNYTRTWPLLESFVRVEGTHDELGWQYQEGQWRLVVRVTKDHPCHGDGSTMRTQREAYASERYANWFDFTKVDTILGTSGPSTPKVGEYKGFAPDFVYLYRPARNATVGQLCALAEVTAERAEQFGARLS